MHFIEPRHFRIKKYTQNPYKKYKEVFQHLSKQRSQMWVEYLNIIVILSSEKFKSFSYYCITYIFFKYRDLMLFKDKPGSNSGFTEQLPN